MKIRIAIPIAACLLGLLSAMPLKAAEPTISGLWQQADPDGRVGGWFVMFESNGVYYGALAKMFPKPGENPNPVCTKCVGEQKGQPSLGLVMIKGMQRHGRAYDNGTILDPRDGAVYQATMEVSPDGQQLTLRGFVGIPIFGRSQVWTRLPETALPPEQTPPNLLPYVTASR